MKNLKIGDHFRSIRKWLGARKKAISRGVARIIKKIRNIPKEAQKSYKVEQSKDLSVRIVKMAAFYAMPVSGIVYIFVFFPLTWINAKNMGFNPIDVLLFTHIAKILPSGRVLDIARFIYKHPHLPTLFSMGVMYGFACLFVPILFIFTKKKGLIELIVISNGLLCGYYFTYLAAAHFYGKIASNLGVFSNLSFIYVFFSYYLAFSLAEGLSRFGIKAKYDHFFMGTHGIWTGWILSRSFGLGTIVFTGFAFLLISFISMAVIEATLGNLIKWFLKGFPPTFKLWTAPSLSSLKHVKKKDFWTPYLIFIGLIVGFPLITFLILTILI
jgi:hypothetical protein